MSNLAFKPKKQLEEQTKAVSTPQAMPKTRRMKITRFEKLLCSALILFIVYVVVSFLGNKADLYEVTAQSSKLKQDIEQQRKMNNDLKAEVEQLSRYDRIAKKAKEMGLIVDENNVKGLNQ